MANEEHLAILRRGVEAWNAWRSEHPDVRPELSRADLREANLVVANLSRADLSDANLNGADLSYAELRQADLSYADLRRAILNVAKLSGAHLRGVVLLQANLSDADLSDANLSDANLSDANLSDANLSRADLSDTNLSRADLSRADLSGSKLNMAKFSGAYLSGADLSRAHLSETLFTNIDLSTIIGLDTVQHSGPSTIGIDTLYLSNGKIPEAFLRGCGVPDALIEYLPSLLGAMQPIQFYSCFISYSSQDEDFARRLHERMRAEHLRVWFAPEDMQGGQKLHEQIEQAIRQYDKVLVILSAQGHQSKQVLTDLRKARKAELATNHRKLFPIRLMSIDLLRDWECIDPITGQDIADEIRAYHIPDFSDWKDHDAFERAFARLLRDLKATDAPPAPAPAPMITPDASGQAKVITLKRRRLQILEEQRALKGINTPPEVIIEIEDLRREISELESGQVASGD